MLQKNDIKNQIVQIVGISVTGYIVWKFLTNNKKTVENKKLKFLERDNKYQQLIEEIRKKIKNENNIDQISKVATMQINKAIVYLLKINYSVLYQKNKQQRMQKLFDLKQYGKELQNIFFQTEQNFKLGQQQVLNDLQLEEQVYEKSKLLLEQESHQYAKYHNEIFLIQSIEQIPSTQQIDKKTYNKILEFKIQEFKKVDIKKLKNHFNMNEINQIINFYLYDQVYQRFGLQTYDIYAYQIDCDDKELIQKEQNVQKIIQSTLISNCQFPY